MNEKLYIVLPAYNEKANIEQTVEQWHKVVEKTGLDSRLIIFDDGSTDNTFEIMNKLVDKYPQFIPITKLNSGHGATCLYAYNYSILHEADFIFQTDSDGQTNPDEFWDFWEKHHEFDFIIGNREKRQDGTGRIIVTVILRLIVWLIFGENIKDLNTPFRLMNAKKLKPILKIIPDNFFLSNVIISMLIVKRKEKYLWLPISFKPRQGGTNSINPKKILSIGLKAIPDFYLIRQNIKIFT